MTHPLFLYLFCSQIWLNPLETDCHFWSNMKKIEKKKKKKLVFKCSYYNLYNKKIMMFVWVKPSYTPACKPNPTSLCSMYLPKKPPLPSLCSMYLPKKPPLPSYKIYSISSTNQSLTRNGVDGQIASLIGVGGQIPPSLVCGIKNKIK